MHNSDNAKNRYQHRRRRHYIDTRVQGRLFWAMLLLETILFAGSLIWLYQNLGVVIEDNLYRVHFSSGDTGSSLFSVVWEIVPIVVLFNILAIWLADFIWRGYIKHIIKALKKIISQAAKLDLRIISMDLHVEHEVIKKALLWQQHERQRYEEVQKGVTALPSELIDPETDADKNNNVSDALMQLKKLALQQNLWE